MSDRPDLVCQPDSASGIARQRRGHGSSSNAPDGICIDCRKERSRTEALAVPPAYEQVWISPRPDSHLQAPGRDTRARKQYRHHPDRTAFRAERRFHHLSTFGAPPPRIRTRIPRDMLQPPGSRAFAIAAVPALPDRASMQVGNPEHARQNRTFGATTLEPRHVALDGDGIALRHTAKGAHRVRRRLRDATLNRMLEQLDDLPGRTLVSRVDAEGEAHRVSRDAVNAWLVEMTENTRMTAKTLRTWNGSTAVLEAALRPGPLTVNTMAEAAAERLRDTPAIARTSHIHPDLIALDTVPEDERQAALAGPEDIRGLRLSEVCLLHLLRQAR